MSEKYKFNVGDLVRVKSIAGPVMAINSFRGTAVGGVRSVYCVWFGPNELEPHSFEFNQDVLELVELPLPAGGRKAK